jgi:hypothetical protein
MKLLRCLVADSGDGDHSFRDDCDHHSDGIPITFRRLSERRWASLGIRSVAVLGLYIALSFAGGWTTPHPGITQMTVSHGPTMPPDPTEPHR